MPVISFANTKGGAGKTTTSIHLACELARKADVILIDADPNCHVMHWAAKPGEYRKEQGPEQFSGSDDNLLPERLTVFRNHSEDQIIDEIEEAAKRVPFVIVDLEGIASKRVGNAISFSDLVVIPMGKDEQEARNSIDTIQAVRLESRRARRQIPFRVLFTRVKPVGEGRTQGHIEREMKGALPDYVMTTQLMERDVIKAIHSTGGPLQDVASGYNIAAAQENIAALAAEVVRTLRASREQQEAVA